LASLDEVRRQVLFLASLYKVPPPNVVLSPPVGPIIADAWYNPATKTMYFWSTSPSFPLIAHEFGHWVYDYYGGRDDCESEMFARQLEQWANNYEIRRRVMDALFSFGAIFAAATLAPLAVEAIRRARRK